MNQTWSMNVLFFYRRLEGGEGAELLIGVEFQSCKAKKVLEMDGGDNSTI